MQYNQPSPSYFVFQSKKATGDYHDEMTSEHFEEWFHDSLMPNIPANSLIVTDNAPYHSRRLEPVPTISSRKQIMQDWLTACGIEFPENALKRELYTLIKAYIGLHWIESLSYVDLYYLLGLAETDIQGQSRAGLLLLRWQCRLRVLASSSQVGWQS